MRQTKGKSEMNSDIKERDEHATPHGLSSAESAVHERLVMTNEMMIKGQIDLVRCWVVEQMRQHIDEAKRCAGLENYMQAQRLRWMADGMGLAAIQLGGQIGLDEKQSLRNARKS